MHGNGALVRAVYSHTVHHILGQVGGRSSGGEYPGDGPGGCLRHLSVGLSGTKWLRAGHFVILSSQLSADHWSTTDPNLRVILIILYTFFFHINLALVPIASY